MTHLIPHPLTQLASEREMSEGPVMRCAVEECIADGLNRVGVGVSITPCRSSDSRDARTAGLDCEAGVILEG